MDIDPLKEVLDIYNNKHNVLMHYLPPETTKKLTRYIYVEDMDELFLNDRLIFVQKSNGKFLKQGIIIKITNDQITIKTSTSNVSFYINTDNYYLFINPRKNKSQKLNRTYLKELLNSLP